MLRTTAALVVLLASACADAGGVGANSTTLEYDAATVSPSEVDSCSLVSSAEAENALGGAFTSGKIDRNGRGETLCVLKDESGGGYVNVTVLADPYSSVEDWSSRAQQDLNYQAEPDNGPWAAGFSACFTTPSACAVSFLAGRIGVFVFVAQGPAGGGEEAFREGVEELARSAAAKFDNVRLAAAPPPEPEVTSPASDEASTVSDQTSAEAPAPATLEGTVVSCELWSFTVTEVTDADGSVVGRLKNISGQSLYAGSFTLEVNDGDTLDGYVGGNVAAGATETLTFTAGGTVGVAGTASFFSIDGLSSLDGGGGGC